MATPSYLKNFGTGSGEQGSLGANETDFFGEGLDAGGPAAPDAAPVDAAHQNVLNNRTATNTADINSNRVGFNQGVTPEQAAAAKPAGATGAYESGSDAGRAAFDTMHDLGKGSGVISMGDFFDRAGEDVGVSHAGDATGVRDPFGIQNPLDFNPIANVVDPNKGLGTTMDGVPGGASGGRPITNLSPETRAAAEVAGGGVLPTAAAGVGDALDQVMGGQGDIPIDSSGNDRGGMGLGGAYSTQLDRVQGIADTSRAGGQGVLNGQVAPGGAGAQQQGDALDAAMSFAKGPRAANDVMTDVNGFLSAPGGPSAAELQLQQAAQGNMSDALSLARSGRARDAGSQARLMSQALANNAATNVDTARDTALLRAKEAETKRGQDLSALGLKGNLAQGVDTNTLGALGLQGDISGALRSGNIQERGQSLNYDQGQNQIGAGLESDVLKTIPQLENIRHQDQFDLTPQQKLAAAKLGGTPDKTTADYVTGLLGDVLSAL